MNRLIWSLWMGSLTVGLAIVLALPMLGLGAGAGGPFAIERVRVSRDLQHVAPLSVRDAIADLVAPGFLLVDLEAVRQRVLALPHVADARVRRVYPGRLEIDIVERQVVARLGDGSLLTEDGGEIPAETLIEEPDVPVIVAASPEERAALLAFQAWAQAELAGIGLEIARLELGPAGGLDLTLSDQVQVRVGSGGEAAWKPRWQRFVLSYEDLRMRAGARPIASVDLRYTNGMAVGWIQSADTPALVARRP